MNDFNEFYPSLSYSRESLYYSVSSISDSLIVSPNDFKVTHLNIRSLLPKIDEFVAILGDVKLEFDCICFSETWLNHSSVNLCNILNYVSHHVMRENNKRGGGVSIYIRNCISSRRIDNLCMCFEYIESLFLDCSRNGTRFIVGVIYRPPNTDFNSFLEALETVIADLSILRCNNIVISGDFNCDLLEMMNDNDCLNFANIMFSNYYTPLITKPTRITDSSFSLIDNFFSGSLHDHTAGILPCALSDHYLIFVVYKNFFENVVICSPKRIKYRIHNDVTLLNLYNSLSAYDFTFILQNEDIDQGIQLLEQVVMNSYNYHCPILNKTISYKNSIKPWIDAELKGMIRRRQNCLLLMRMGKMDRQAYNRYRNMVTGEIRRRKTCYYGGLLDSFGGNMKKTWSLVNRILKPGGTEGKGVTVKLRDGDLLIADSLGVANKFNNYFCSIGEQITNSFPNVGIGLSNIIPGNFINSFFFLPVNSNDVFNTIISLNNKSSSINKLPTFVLKYLGKLLSPILSVLINKSLSHGIFPNILKKAHVVPIHKGGDAELANNYRPISVLSDFSKIYERLVHSQLIGYLDSRNVLYTDQYGFRKNSSTSQASLSFLQCVYEALDAGDLYFSMFLDFRKAFDSVSHPILLSKLYSYGIRGIPHSWFHSYLSSRSQCVVINDTCSGEGQLTCGVPQGSILGPLLFLIFINDFPLCSDYFRFTLFADDSTISCRIPRNQLSGVHDIINAELNVVGEWLINNKIMLNIDKTKYVIFSYRMSYSLPSVKLHDNEIECVRSVRFLGLVLDSNLRFEEHISNISIKVSRSVGILSKVNSFLPRSILVMLYYALVHPYYMYAIEVWFNSPDYIKNRLIVLHKRALRVLTCSHYLAHSAPLYKTLGMLTLDNLFKLRIGIYMYKTLNIQTFNPVLRDFVDSNTDQHIYLTRNSSCITLPRYMKSKSQSCIFYVASSLWNSVSIDLKTLNSISQFKFHYKKFLLHSQ